MDISAAISGDSLSFFHCARLKHRRVHLPELVVPLLEGRHGGLRRRHRVRVEAERLVPPDDADVVLVRLQDLLERRLDARAVGALEVGPLHDRHFGLLRAGPGAIAGVDVARLRRGSRLGRGSRRAALAVLDQVLVEVLLLHAARQRRVRAPELRLDHRLERLVRHRARHARAVDEEVRGPVRSQLRRLRLVVADGLGGLGRVQVALVALHVEADVAGHGVHLVLLERVGLARVVRLEQLVVHLPELALLLRGDGGLGRVGRVRMHGQRIVLEDEADVGPVVPLDQVERVDDAAAERTLEVRPFDDGHLGLGAAFLRRVTEGDLVDLVGTRRRRRRSRNGRLRVSKRTAEAAAFRHLVADGEPRDGADANGDKHVPIALHAIPFSSLPDGRPAKARTHLRPCTASSNSR